MRPPPDGHSIPALQALVMDFVRERDWQQFHDPKNLAMAIAVEAGELMDHFRWVPNTQSHAVMADPRTAADVRSEVADVMILLLEFAQITGIDLAEAVQAKVAVNATRYPVELSKGNALKHNRLAEQAQPPKPAQA